MTHFRFHHSFPLSSLIYAFITHFCLYHSFLPLWELLPPFPEGAWWGSVGWTVGRRVVRWAERPVQGRTVEQSKSLKH